MKGNQDNIRKGCPKCDGSMTRLASCPIYHCFYCGHEEDAEEEGELS
jgi:primosomal protein N'